MPQKKPEIQTDVDIAIPFQDCDPMGITWHGNYFRYFESARAALLNLINYNYSRMSETGYQWPIVETKVKYLSSTSFSGHISVNAHLAEYENRLKINYIIRDKDTGKICTRGYTIQVAVKSDTNEMCFCSPDELIESINIYYNANS